MKMVVQGPTEVWAINSSGEIFRKNKESWEKIPGSLSDISVGETVVWGVSGKNEISKYDKKKGNWKQIPGQLKQV